jgi:hypothetical protein
MHPKLQLLVVAELGSLQQQQHLCAAALEPSALRTQQYLLQ